MIQIYCGFFLSLSCYSPQKIVPNHLNCNDRNLDSQLERNENFILMGHFNVEPNDATMKHFCQICRCKHIVKDKTYFKNHVNPTCTDLIDQNPFKGLR